MRDSTVLPLQRRRLSSAARLRRHFRGLAYAFGILVAMGTGWMLQALLDASLMPGLDRLSAHLETTLRECSLASVPTLFALVVTANLAPAAGRARTTSLLAAGVASALWCQWAVGGGMPARMWIGCLCEASVWTSLCLAVFMYQGDVRKTGERLLRVEIEQMHADNELKQARLNLLRAQVEPHFLFNTLTAVRVLARTDPASAASMADNLARYFSAALPRLRHELASLADELELVRAYLDIFRTRMGPRLRFAIDLPEELAPTPVPPMLLLTLVENSLKHGVAPLVEGGSIEVRASRHGSALRLQVADSGRGMVARLGRGVGLANVRQRLLLHYGEAASLTLAGAEPHGVIATLLLPEVAADAA